MDDLTSTTGVVALVAVAVALVAVIIAVIAVLQLRRLRAAQSMVLGDHNTDLVAHAARRGTKAQRTQLIERLFSAYFMEGENIGDWQVLERLGIECGLERQGLANHLAESRVLADPTGRRVLHADHSIGGVPHFVLNARYTLSGAHSPGAIVEAMMLAVRD